MAIPILTSSMWGQYADKPMQPSAPAPIGETGGMTGLALNQAKAPPPLSFVNDSTPAMVKPQSPAPLTSFQKNSAAGAYGMQAAGQVRTGTDAGGAMAGVVGSTAQGAMMGGSVGGAPGAAVGAGVGFVMGGLNAFMGVRAARKERDRQEALRNDAIRMEKEEIARDEKWRIQYRLDSLEKARYQRKKFSMQQAYQAAQAQGKNLMALIASNADLKQKYAKFGFV